MLWKLFGLHHRLALRGEVAVFFPVWRAGRREKAIGAIAFRSVRFHFRDF